MRTLLVLAALTAVALAGCTEEPASGDVTGASVSAPFGGSLSIETQSFNNPSPTTGQQGGDECQQNEVEQLADYHCEFPYTKAELHLMEYPDPNGATFSAQWAGSGNTEAFPSFSENGTAPNVMYVSMYDNEADCDGETDDAACDKTMQFENVEVYLGEVLLGTVSFSGTFELNGNLTGVSFDMSYSGKDATVTLNGASPDLSYSLVLYEEAEDGTATAAETISVTPGENEVSASRDIADFVEAHVHVAGTKINLAQGTIE